MKIGILNQAKRAKEETEKGASNEQAILNDYEDMINGNYVEIKQVTDENPGVLEGSGIESDPYTINSIEDLVVFSYNVRNGNTYEGEFVNLGLSLDFNQDISYVNSNREDYTQYGYNGKLKEMLTTGSGFLPIGKYDIDEISNEELVRQNNFEGIFDGKGNVIKNLYINEVAEKDVEQIGLFASNCGEIKNLGLVNVDIYIEGKTISTGGIAGATFGNINKCYTDGNIETNVTLWSRTGGVTGTIRKDLEILECLNNANITVTNLTDTGETTGAGIVAGQSNNVKVQINKCYNTGNISAFSEKQNILLGGIGIGITNGKITNCYNKGKIEAKSNNSNNIRIGGISGNMNYETEIKNCYNIGNIVFDGKIDSTSVFIGGICGYSIGAKINNVYNAKDIEIKGNTKTIRIGGLCGSFFEEELTNVYNIGKIIAKNTTSENIGSITGSVTNTVILKDCNYLKETYSKPIGVTNGLAQENNDTEELENISDFPSVLSVVNEDGAFKEDTNNINNGYPILAWQ